MKIYLDDVAEKSLPKAEKLLANIPDGVYRAVGSAFKRAAQHGLTIGMKIVSEEYAIGQNELKARTQNINAVVRDEGGSYEVTFGYRGFAIPLIKFDTSFSRGGKVSSRVLRANSKTVLDHAFYAQVNGHTGIYERVGPSRVPIEKKFGPASVQAFYAHEETVDKMDESLREVYDRRIDHEIYRILNGR